MALNNRENIIVKVDYSNNIIIDETIKITGLIKGRYIVPLIDNLNLEANPRASKTGNTTNAIQETLEISPNLFPFKSKGLLLASSKYQLLDRNRIKIIPQDISIEGILDGGHNSLAIGLFILEKAFDYSKENMPKGQKTWDQFKSIWIQNRDLIDIYFKAIASKEIDNDLDFYIPIEILVPSNQNDCNCVSKFTRNLLEICEARNNNAELPLSTKNNQSGYFDYLKDFLQNANIEVFDRIEWKTNNGGDVKVADLIALSWIPLSLITPVKDKNGRQIDPISPNLIYSGKGSCLKQFDRLMSSPEVTKESANGNYKSILINEEVKSALKIASELPAIYDYIYENFPNCYNQAGGSYGRITAVGKLNKNRKIKQAPFSGKPIDTLSPDGFIMPIVYGMISLLENKEIDGKRQIVWKQDPLPFLINNLQNIVKKYFGLFELCDYDPQKVGKATQSYQQTRETVESEFTSIQLALLMKNN